MNKEETSKNNINDVEGIITSDNTSIPVSKSANDELEVEVDKNDVIHAVLDNNVHINDDGSIEVVGIEDMSVTVYGPPSWFEEKDVIIDTDPITGEPSTINPITGEIVTGDPNTLEIDDMPDVYGPDPSLIDDTQVIDNN